MRTLALAPVLATVLATLLALPLAGCDAGHLENPGMDNLSPGPRLELQFPASWTRVRPETIRPALRLVTGEEVLATSPAVYAPVGILFRLRDHTSGQRIWWRIDDRESRQVEDAKKSVGLPLDLALGTHLITAYVGDASGVPVGNPEAVIAQPFYFDPRPFDGELVLTNEERARLVDAEGNPLTDRSWQQVGYDEAQVADPFGYGGPDEQGDWKRFDERAPVLVLSSPLPSTTPGNPATVHFSLARAPLVEEQAEGPLMHPKGDHRVRVRVDGGEWVVHEQPGSVELPRGSEAEFVLEESRGRRPDGEGTRWVTVRGSQNERRVKN